MSSPSQIRVVPGSDLGQLNIVTEGLRGLPQSQQGNTGSVRCMQYDSHHVTASSPINIMFCDCLSGTSLSVPDILRRLRYVIYVQMYIENIIQYFTRELE